MARLRRRRGSGRLQRVPRRKGIRGKGVLAARRVVRRSSKRKRDGYLEGYLRGRAAAIVQQIRTDTPFRKLHILYVTSGKGFPYSPIDEGMIATLRGMVEAVTVAGPKDAIFTLADETKPNLVLALDGMDLPVEQLIMLRERGILSALWLTDDPYYTDIMVHVVRYYDYVFTLELNCVGYYQSHGCSQVYYLPFGAYPGHFTPSKTSNGKWREVCFVGSAFWNRVHFLESTMPTLMSYDTLISGIWWDRATHYAKYAHKMDLGNWMGPYETAEMYNATKIVINLHRAHDDETMNSNSARIEGASPNPRTFEIMSCATLQLTDERSDLARFYTPGVEIETYHSQEEMLQKIRHYLKHEDQRREIALRGFARTLREHTYEHRLNQLLATIFDGP